MGVLGLRSEGLEIRGRNTLGFLQNWTSLLYLFNKFIVKVELVKL